jgi:WD40 repeat protein
VAAALLALGLGAGCGRGLVGNPLAVGGEDASQADDVESPPAADAAARAPDERRVDLDALGEDAPGVDANPIDAAPIDATGIDAPRADATAMDAASDVRPGPPLPNGFPPAPPLPASTTWTSCGKLGEHLPAALAHSPDGKTLLVGYNDAKIGFSPLTTGIPQAPVQTSGALARLAYSHTGALFAGVGPSGLGVWTSDGSKQGNAKPGLEGYRVLAFSPTADLILVAGDASPSGATLQLWQVKSAGNAVEVTRTAGWSGSPVAAFAGDGTSVRWLDGGKALSDVALDGRPGAPRSLAMPLEEAVFSADGAYLAGLASGGTTLVVYHAADGTHAWDRTLASRPQHLVFLGGPPRVASLTATQVEVRALADGTTTSSFKLDHPLSAVDAAPAGDILTGITDEGAVVQLSVTDGKVGPGPTVIDTEPDDVWSIDFSRDGRYLAVGTELGSIVYDLRERLVQRYLGLGGQVEFSPLSHVVAESGGHLCQLEGLSDDSPDQFPQSECACGFVFSPEGSRLAGSVDKTVTVFAADGTTVRTLSAQVLRPGLRFSPDGSWLVSSSEEAWDTSMWKGWTQTPDPAPFTGDSLMVEIDNSVVFSPDGSQVLMTTSQRLLKGTLQWHNSSTLRVTRTGALVRAFGSALGRRPDFSPDGAWITAGPTVHRLDSPVTRDLAPMTQVSRFLPDGRIVAGQADGTVIFHCPRAP